MRQENAASPHTGWRAAQAARRPHAKRRLKKADAPAQTFQETPDAVEEQAGRHESARHPVTPRKAPPPNLNRNGTNAPD